MGVVMSLDWASCRCDGKWAVRGPGDVTEMCVARHWNGNVTGGVRGNELVMVL